MKVVKVLRNFLVLNLFLLVPLAVAVSLNAVREMSVEVISDSSSSNILVGDGRSDRTGDKYDLFFKVDADVGKVQVAKQYCPTESVLTTPRFLFESQGALDISVKAIRLSKYFVLNYTVPLRKIVSDYVASDGVQLSLGDDGLIHLASTAQSCGLEPRTDADAWEFENVRIPPKALACVCALEIGFLLLAWLAAVFMVKPLTRKELLVNSLYSSLLFAVCVSFVIPLQTFLSNKVTYEIATLALAIDLVKYFAIALAVTFVCVTCLSKAFGAAPYVLLFGFVLYEYLQTGILSIGEPVISGNLSYYANKLILVRDTIVVFCILAFCCWLIRGGRTWYKWAVLIVGVMSLCSLCDVRANRSTVAIDCEKTDDLCPLLDVAQSVTYSKQRNVLVFVLDSCTTEVVHEIFSGDEKLRQSFAGFCSFDNNIGIHHITSPSTAGWLTGKMYRDGEATDGYAAYVNSVFSESSLLYRFRDKGYPTYFMCKGYSLGMASPRLAGVKTDDVGSNGSPLFSRFGDSQKYTIYELTRFRMSPFVLKPYVYKYTNAGMGGYARLQSEFGLYSILKRAPVVSDTENTFHALHTEGGHFPYDVNRFGQKCVSTDEGYGPYLEKTYFALNNLADLFENFRRRGIYDCSDIFVLADHGADETKTMPDVEKGLPLRAHPMLMVKPANSTGEFMIDHTTSTSMLNLHSVLEREMDRSLTLDEIKQLLTSAERKFVWIGENSFSEWIVNANREAKLISDRDISARRKR